MTSRGFRKIEHNLKNEDNWSQSERKESSLVLQSISSGFKCMNEQALDEFIDVNLGKSPPNYIQIGKWRP